MARAENAAAGMYHLRELAQRELRATLANPAEHITDRLVTGVKAPVALLRNTAAYQRMGLPIETAISAPIERVKGLARDELGRVEARLRARFQGYDDSNSLEKKRARRQRRLRALFDSLDADAKRNSVPIDELETLFTCAGLFETRTVVGQLAYDADVDGNGSLEFDEFVVVLDKLRCVTVVEAHLREVAARSCWLLS